MVPITLAGQSSGTTSTSGHTLTVEFKFNCEERLTMLEHVTAVLSLTPTGTLKGLIEIVYE